MADRYEVRDSLGATARVFDYDETRDIAKGMRREDATRIADALAIAESLAFGGQR